jgi:hypothetical protein
MFMLFTFFSLFLLLREVTSRTSYSLSNSEYNALHSLYNSTNGVQWTWFPPYAIFGYPWNFTVPAQNPCSSTKPWQGVSCSSICGLEPCTILDLDLHSHRLQGIIPHNIDALQNLKSLELYDNNLNGTIPDSIGNLKDLEDLFLYQNQLTGILPLSFHWESNSH